MPLRHMRYNGSPLQIDHQERETEVQRLQEIHDTDIAMLKEEMRFMREILENTMRT